MGIADFYKLLGGLALFLYGINLASNGLRKVAGAKLKVIMKLLTTNRFLGLIAGVFVTIGVQSSSATTVMLVGLAEAEIINLTQAIGVTLGASIGTTLTVQLIAFDFVQYAWIMFFIGFIINSVAKYENKKIIGKIIMGFSLVFIGMWLIKETVQPLKSDPMIGEWLSAFSNNPILGTLVAFVISAIIQSSAATIGILLALISSGVAITPVAIAAVVLGANIGTCTTALLASLGASRKGKQVALAHFLFKIAGAMIMLPFIGYFAGAVSGFNNWLSFDATRSVANIDTFYAIYLAIIFLPFVNVIAKVVEKILPDKITDEVPLVYISSDDLKSPQVAFGKVRKELQRLAKRSLYMSKDALRLLESHDLKIKNEIHRLDDEIDSLFNSVTMYLTNIESDNMSKNDIEYRTVLFIVSRNLENIGDIISKDICNLSEKKIRGNHFFAMEEISALRILWQRIEGNLKILVENIIDDNIADIGEEIIEYDNKLDEKIRLLTTKHYNLVKDGVQDAVDSGIIYIELLSKLRYYHREISDVINEFKILESNRSKK